MLPPPGAACRGAHRAPAARDRLFFIPFPVHFFTYDREFITQYCQASALLELESLLSQQSLREAFSDAELSTAKQRHQQVQDYIQVRGAGVAGRELGSVVPVGRGQDVARIAVPAGHGQDSGGQDGGACGTWPGQWWPGCGQDGGALEELRGVPAGAAPGCSRLRARGVSVPWQTGSSRQSFALLPGSR